MLLPSQTVSPLLVPGPVIHKVKHHTWIDYYFTFLGLPSDPTYSYISCFHTADTLVADLQQFGDDHAIASVRRQLPIDSFHAPETALLLKNAAPGGVQARALSGVITTPLINQGRVIGHSFEDSDAHYCILGDIRPSNPNTSRGDQTLDVLQTIQNVLSSVGMDFRHVVRTWFYNDRILDWYAEFNAARSTFFQRHGIALMPASTGIGVANSAGAALVAKAIAVLPKSPGIAIRRVDSPLQNEASKYGSAFSRALEVADPAARVLYISGTASIEANGQTAHVGNASKQIEKTLEVVEAILARNAMSLSDTVRAIGYFRHSEHIPLWHDYCRARKMPPLPILLTECDICRDNLLFEIELDAARQV